MRRLLLLLTMAGCTQTQQPTIPPRPTQTIYFLMEGPLYSTNATMVYWAYQPSSLVHWIKDNRPSHKRETQNWGIYSHDDKTWLKIVAKTIR